MDRAVAAIAPGESFTELQRKVDQAARLERDVEARENEYLKLKDILAKAGADLDNSNLAQEKLTARIESLETDNKELTATLKATQDKLAVYEPKKKPPTASPKQRAAAGAISIWWWVGGGVLAAVVLVAGVWWMGERKNNEDGGENADTQDESKRSEAKKDGNPAAGN